MLALGTATRFAARHPVLRQGEPSTHIVLVQDGWLKVTAGTGNAVEALLALRGPGDIVGERAALNGTPRSATVTALETVTALMVGADRFASFLDAHTHAARRLMSLVSDRHQSGDRRRLEFGTGPVRVRLAKLLLQLSDSYGELVEDGVAVALPLTQDELAATISAARESVTKMMAELRRRGVVRTGRRKLVVMRPEVLRRIAASG